ncbi:pirin family protein [Halopiger aswanensis]|uniref:Pirin N-terminal domain-containing protein n=1 Tax=Halopiger aswanensis TaxID=148449 RepID=A0A419W0Y1_9EURY|nr:pirin family protein [Halopiger aswanensis]RKD89119.1 hypothetical protein ATJ93_3945 [Halopiger aswanensis]
MSSNETPTDRDGPLSGGLVRHGAGVTANRAFPTENYPVNLDPFVLFERFYIDPEKGFPMHPHKGFEIVTYMLEGGMDHEDTLDVSYTARAGEAMRITTGSGIRHSEFAADGEACNGLQLWVNLPDADKDAEPDYADATADELPTEDQKGATVTTVVGDGSPIDLHTEMEYYDSRVTDTWTWSLPNDWAGFLYGVAGEGTVDGSPFAEGDVFPIQADRNEDIVLEAEEPFRVVAVSGRPHGDPIRQRGPFVL